jgi:Cu-processing system permease protein
MIHIIRKEVRDALRNRWLIGYTVLLAVLGFVAALMGARSAAGLGLQMFGRTTATLTNLCLLLAPLIALSMGSATIAGERDRGTLEHLLAQPLERSELLLGKYLGLLAALCMATLVGFFPAGLMVVVAAGGVALAHYMLFPLLAILLIAAMLALGVLISVRSHGGVQAQGRAILLWFLFVLLYDLLLMGTLVTAGLSGGALAILLLVNPVDAARVLVVLALEPDLYLLGPAGALLVGHLTRLGTAAVLVTSMFVWTVAPLLLALVSFRIGPQAARNRRLLVDEEWGASEAGDEVVVGAGLRQDENGIGERQSPRVSRAWMVTAARAIGLARSEP